MTVRDSATSTPAAAEQPGCCPHGRARSASGTYFVDRRKLAIWASSREFASWHGNAGLVPAAHSGGTVYSMPDQMVVNRAAEIPTLNVMRHLQQRSARRLLSG